MPKNLSLPSGRIAPAFWSIFSKGVISGGGSSFFLRPSFAEEPKDLYNHVSTRQPVKSPSYNYRRGPQQCVLQGELQGQETYSRTRLPLIEKACHGQDASLARRRDWKQEREVRASVEARGLEVSESDQDRSAASSEELFFIRVGLASFRHVECYIVYKHLRRPKKLHDATAVSTGIGRRPKTVCDFAAWVTASLSATGPGEAPRSGCERIESVCK